MFKQILSITAMMALLSGTVTSCKSGDGGFKKTKDGIEYKIVKDEKGPNAKIGDIISYHLILKVGDSVLLDNRKMMGEEPLQVELQDNPNGNKKTDPTEVLTMMSAGDSAIIHVEMDSATRQMYTFAKPTDKLEFIFKLVSVKSKDEAEKDQRQAAEAQNVVDEKLITEYLAKNNINAQKTASGLYYVINKNGSGANIAEGQTAKVMYTGKTLDGTKFDSNIDKEFNHTEPLEFAVGRKQVISGWDEGLLLLNKGSKATFIIPSSLAYGDKSPSPLIPANSILLFDVELIDFK
jgi:FKBP-type peptidyl-prolyl cis-trans isomerase FkpA